MNSLKNQILALVGGLVALTSITILTLFWVDTSAFTRSSIARDFVSATDSFQQLLATRENALTNSAALLTSDFGFKQAVATRDAPTIESVLVNHGQRSQAQLMFVTDLRGQLIAATHPSLSEGAPLPFPALLQKAAREGTAIALIELDQVLYQVVVLPIRAPRPIAFAAVGFRFDENVAGELKRLTGLDVTIVAGDGTRTVSTLASADLREALDAPAVVDSKFGLPFADTSRFVSQRQPLPTQEDGTGELVLSATLKEEYSAFVALRNELLLVFLLVLGLAIVSGVLFAGNLARPINRLVETAMRMARGNYDEELEDRKPSREVGALFEAFREMGHDIKQREEMIRWQAEHDELTGLLARNKAMELIDSEVVRPGKRAAIIAFSIDGLREISDALGPAITDEYVRILGERLLHSKTAMLGARLATNEFAQVVILDEDESPESACKAALDSLGRPIQIQDLTLRRVIRAGYSLAPDQGSDAAELLKRASIAIERARQEQMVIRAYRDGEDEEQARRLQMINELKTAITANDGQLFMAYQPKLNLKTGQVDKMEALIRWIHPELGFISPELFISLAEQSDLILELTQWVIGTVIRQRAEWQPAFPDLQIAINVSAQDLEQETLVDDVMKALNQADLSPASLCFELTERDVMNNADRAARTMQQLRELGFNLSVDDYGIGQSSLSKLKQLPVDEIKIDKLFIMTLEESEGDRVIVESTIELGHRFGLRVIAEGVETAGTIDLLQGYGCDYAQGYHLSKPLPAAELVDWLNAFESEQRSAAR